MARDVVDDCWDGNPSVFHVVLFGVVGEGKVGEWDWELRGGTRRAVDGPAAGERWTGRAGEGAGVERDGPDKGSSQSSSKLSGESCAATPLTRPSPRKLVGSRFGVDTGDGRFAVFGFTGMENSKSSSQFSVTGLRRGCGGAADPFADEDEDEAFGPDAIGIGAAAIVPPPDDMLVAVAECRRADCSVVQLCLQVSVVGKR